MAAIISSSARNYAKAAFGVASERGDFDEWLRALDRLTAILGVPIAHLVLTSPAVSAEDKRGALDRLVPDLPPLVRNFANILIERGRVGLVPEIAAAFGKRLNEHRGIVTADVTTAVALDAQLEQTLMQRLARYLNHDPQRIVIQSRVDPNIIGGVVARVGDTLIDDSVRGRLDRLRRTLAAT